MITWFKFHLTLKPASKAIEKGKLFHVPLTSLVYTLPDDGLPLLPSWRMTAGDIYFNGFQPLREPLEVKEVSSTAVPGSTVALLKFPSHHGRSWKNIAWFCKFGSYPRLRCNAQRAWEGWACSFLGSYGPTTAKMKPLVKKSRRTLWGGPGHYSIAIQPHQAVPSANNQ